MNVTNVTTKTQPLWEQAGFIPCRITDTPTAATEAAILPGLDGVLQAVADRFLTPAHPEASPRR